MPARIDLRAVTGHHGGMEQIDFMAIVSDLHLSVHPLQVDDARDMAGIFMRDITTRLDALGGSPDRTRLVFLGDTFELIRNPAWLDPALNPGGLRPWRTGGRDAAEQRAGLEEFAGKLLTEILTANAPVLDTFEPFAEKVFVRGNHDRLVWEFESLKSPICEHVHGASFMTDGEIADFDVYAEHGDARDAINRRDERQPTCLGDAVVIEFVNRLPLEVRERTTDPALLEKIREIDNVRPMTAVPLWLAWRAERLADPNEAEILYAAWESAAQKLFECEYVRENDSWLNPFDRVDRLQLALKSPRWIREFVAGRMDLSEESEAREYLEAFRRIRTPARYAVGAHTHVARAYPLGDGRIYFNTGTWRTFHSQAPGLGKPYFEKWLDMTYLLLRKNPDRTVGYETVSRVIGKT